MAVSKDVYGLLGKKIGHSYSPSYFNNKFNNEGINAVYQLFELDAIEGFKSLIKSTKNIKGLNVTIPFKQQIIPYLDALSDEANQVGAVNTITFKRGKLKGYNTDVFGFKHTLELLKVKAGKALVFGTGGASKAVQYVLKEHNISFQLVSRTETRNTISYTNLSPEIGRQHSIWINCTPVGTHPKSNECLPLPYSCLTGNHTVIDLVYNPPHTLFLQNAEKAGAQIMNGLPMLEKQAQKAWELWQS